MPSTTYRILRKQQAVLDEKYLERLEEDMRSPGGPAAAAAAAPPPPADVYVIVGDAAGSSGEGAARALHAELQREGSGLAAGDYVAVPIHNWSELPSIGVETQTKLVFG